MKTTRKPLFISLICLFLLLLATLCAVACQKEIPREPTALAADFWQLTWEGHPDATEFAVEISSKEYRTTETSFQMFEYIAPGKTAKIRVRAIFGSDTDVSEWVETVYTAEEVTEGLIYEPKTDPFGEGHGYVAYCPADRIPENGELVFPDFYEDQPVTEVRSETPNKHPVPTGIAVDPTTSDYDGVSYAGISRVRLPSQLNVIDGGAFHSASITEIYLPPSVSIIHYAAFESCTQLRRINLPEELTIIGLFAFSKCSSLTEITLPPKLDTIGVAAFQASGLVRIAFPETVSALYENVLADCAALDEIVITEHINTIRPGALDGTGWYLNQPDGMLIIDNRLYGYKGEMPENTSLVIPDTVTSFAGWSTFKEQKNLVSVTIPASIKTIPLHAFYGCENLREVNLTQGLESIEGWAFMGCGIEQITLPESLKLLGGSAFEDCTKLTSIVIPSGIRQLGSTFRGCVSLSQVTLPDGLEKIGAGVFVGCRSLTSLHIPDSVTDFDLEALALSGVTHFVWPKNVGIDEWMFVHYPNGMPMNYLVIQKDTVVLQYARFSAHPNINTFYFEGTAEEYEKIGILHTSNEAWENSLRIYYYSETAPEEEGLFWHYVDGLPVAWE